MACNASKTSLLRAIAKRGYSTCPRPSGDLSGINVKVLENKLVVATAEATVPVSRVSLVIGAGSRNEAYDTLGASHLLRLAGGLSTKNSSAFAISRNIQQVGGTLSTWGDREVVGYTISTTMDNVETGLRYLQDFLQPAFKPWELKDNAHTLVNQLNAVSKENRAVELVHKAAFRKGLGNSIYAPRFQLGNLSSESLLHYATQTFGAGKAALVGVGVELNALVGYAQTLEFSGCSGNSVPSSWYGGDARKDTTGHQAVVAIAGEGASAGNQKEALAFEILKQALGAGAATKRGNSAGLFGEAVQCAGAAGAVTVRGLNASYSDAGLFGFVVSADSKDIGKTVEFLVRGLKSAPVSEKDVARGKALLKARVISQYSSDSGLIKEIGRQAALNRTVLEAEALLSAIDGISASDVQKAAKKAGGSKLAVGAIGNLANVPYASDLA